MIEDMCFLLKDRYKCHQGKSEDQNCHNESGHSTDFGGPGILLLIVQGCPILSDGDLIEPGEPMGAVNYLLLFCFSGMD